MNSMPVAKKSLGQHWLSDEAALTDICEAGKVDKNDTILEIGPGNGTLTRHLVERAKHVIAVELDGSLVRQLSQQKIANLEVVQGDILRFDLTALPPAYKVVANIPYYLTSKLLRVLSESSNPPSACILLVQKEVAQRVAARPGGMSILSVTTQFYWQVSTGNVVPAKLFTPPPKVDSQILILVRRPKPQLPNVNPKLFFRLVKAGFSARRKTLLNTLSSSLKIGKLEITSLLTSSGIDPQTRPQQLSLNDWEKIYDRALKFL